MVKVHFVHIVTRMRISVKDIFFWWSRSIKKRENHKKKNMKWLASDYCFLKNKRKFSSSSRCFTPVPKSPKNRFCKVQIPFHCFSQIMLPHHMDLIRTQIFRQHHIQHALACTIYRQAVHLVLLHIIICHHQVRAL